MSDIDIYQKLDDHLKDSLVRKEGDAFYHLVAPQIVNTCEAVLFSRFYYIPQTNTVWVAINVFHENKSNYLIELWGDIDEMSKGYADRKHFMHHKPAESRLVGREVLTKLEDSLNQRYDCILCLESFVLENDFFRPRKTRKLTLEELGYVVY